jgi:hypothetical protein
VNAASLVATDLKNFLSYVFDKKSDHGLEELGSIRYYARHRTQRSNWAGSVLGNFSYSERYGCQQLFANKSVI